MNKATINELKSQWTKMMKKHKWPHTLASGYLDLFDQLNTASAREADKVLDKVADMNIEFQTMVDLELDLG
jgi:hypothetical protein